MRIIYSERANKLYDELKPYFGTSKELLNGKIFKDGTPREIIEKYELWKRICAEEEAGVRSLMEAE